MRSPPEDAADSKAHKPAGVNRVTAPSEEKKKGTVSRALLEHLTCAPATRRSTVNRPYVPSIQVER